MNLGGPSAHLGARRGQDPGWRRSWELPYWDGLMSEVEVVPQHTGLMERNPLRPQSAREGGSHSQNLDRCLQELERVQCQTYFKGGSPVSSPGQVSKVELVPPSPPQPTPARTPRPQSAIEGRRQMNEWLHELEKMQSGDYFEGSPTDSPEVEPRQTVHLGRTPRPQSAIEGGSHNLDRWLQELERMENGRYFGNPDRVQRDQVQAPFYDRTASMPTLHTETVGSGLPHHYQGLPLSPSLCSRDRDLSPCGTSSLCDSSLGSQESLRAGLSSAPDHNGSWERAIIKQAPGKEQAKLSSLTPVRVGWLPIQRRALLRDAPAPGPGHPHLQVNLASQVRLKPAITPTFRKNPVKGNGITAVEGEVEKVKWSQPSVNTVGLRTRWLPDQAPSPSTQHQVSGKESSVQRERDNRSLGWHDQRRSWPNRTPSHLSCSGTPTQSNNSLPGANNNSEPTRMSPLHRTTSNNQQPSHTDVTPYGTSSQTADIQTRDDSDSEPCWRSSLHRTNSFQTSSPSTIRPTVQKNPSHTEVTPSGTKSASYRSNSPLCKTNSVQQKPSHTEVAPYRTSSEPYRATSLHKRTSSLPQPSPAAVVSPTAPGTTTGTSIILKTTTPAFSSITIASKKISRTASLPGSRPLSPGSRAPRPQSYHSDEARVSGYKTPRPQSYHSDEARVPGYKTPRPQSYHSDEARVPGYKTPRPQSYLSDEARVPGYKTPRPQSYHTNQARLSTSCTSVTQQDQVHHHHPTGTDPSSTPVTLRRKATATIVKVTDFEVHTLNSEPVNRLNGRQSPVSSVSGDQPNDQGTVVGRRKATIIKVTEHRESYSPGQDTSGGSSSSSRPSEYRHSYTEGEYRHNSPWQQGAINSPMNSMESLQSILTTPSQYLLESSMDRIDRPNSAIFLLTPNKSTSTTTVALRDMEGSRGGGKPMQKSTLMLFINPPSPSSKDTSIEKVGGERGGGERWAQDTARRPVSCYANVFGHTDPTEPCPVPETVTVTQAGPRHWSPETVTVTQAGPRHWSMGLPNQTQNTNIDPVRDWVKDTVASNSRLNTGSSSSSINAGPAGRDREMCPPEAEFSRPQGRGTERQGDPPPLHPHLAGARSSQPQPPAIPLIKHQDPPSHQQSPEAVLALNAATIIANIKLQRQLSLRKTTPHDLSTQDSRSSTSPEGKTLVKDAGGCVRPRTDDNRLDPGETTRNTHHTTQIHVGFIPLNSDSDPETSKANIPSPREALERSRPHFISRSQGRLREMARRAEERREERRSDHQPEEMMLMHHRGGHSTRPSPLSDNLFRPRERAITGKEMQLRTRQNYKNLPEVRRKQEEEKRKEDYLTNRLRANQFKKKLLEQVLQRDSH